MMTRIFHRGRVLSVKLPVPGRPPCCGKQNQLTFRSERVNLLELDLGDLRHMKLAKCDWTKIKGALSTSPKWARQTAVAMIVAAGIIAIWLFSAPSIDEQEALEYLDVFQSDQGTAQPSLLATVEVLYTQNAQISGDFRRTPGVVDTAVAATFESLSKASTATQDAIATERALKILSGIETSFAATLGSMATRAAETERAPRLKGSTPSP